MPWIVLIVDFWTWTQHTFFPCLFFSPFILPFIFLLSPPSVSTNLFLLSPSSIFSFTQGQRHEEPAGFPAEEEWIPRKQPSQQVRQIHEVSQVSGHFLTACCMWVCVCEAVFRVSPRLAMTWPWKTDMWAVASEGSVYGMRGCNKKDRWKQVKCLDASF